MWLITFSLFYHADLHIASLTMPDLQDRTVGSILWTAGEPDHSARRLRRYEEGTVSARRSSTVQRQRVGVHLRRLRESAKLTTEQVAEILECSDSKISRIETGHVGVTPHDVKHLLDLYGVTGEQRDGLIRIVKETRKRGWWREYSDVPIVPAYINLEVAAESIRTYAALIVPGLLQTPQYARAVISAVRPELPIEELERRITLRMRRQSLLSEPNSPSIRAVLDEAALRRPIGGPVAMRQQIDHLVETAALTNVTLQVLPFRTGEHAGMDGQFIILSFPGAVEPDAIYFDNVASDLYIEKTETARYPALFDRLCADALDPSESVAFLSELSKEP